MSERLDHTYAADRTALLIVDPYNDFMSEGCKLYERTTETAEAVGFYQNTRKLIPAIRTARSYRITAGEQATITTVSRIIGEPPGRDHTSHRGDGGARPGRATGTSWRSTWTLALRPHRERPAA